MEENLLPLASPLANLTHIDRRRLSHVSLLMQLLASDNGTSALPRRTPSDPLQPLNLAGGPVLLASPRFMPPILQVDRAFSGGQALLYLAGDCDNDPELNTPVPLPLLLELLGDRKSVV